MVAKQAALYCIADYLQYSNLYFARDQQLQFNVNVARESRLATLASSKLIDIKNS
jgi:hypothetical protein